MITKKKILFIAAGAAAVYFGYKYIQKKNKSNGMPVVGTKSENPNITYDKFGMPKIVFSSPDPSSFSEMQKKAMMADKNSNIQLL